MKGRICYATFFENPGIEKLSNCVQVKSSFLRPVTPYSTQREPFSLRSAAGDRTGLLTCQFSYLPAAAVFSNVFHEVIP